MTDTLIRLLLGTLPVVVFLLGLILLDSYKLVPLKVVLIAIVAGAAMAGLGYLANRELLAASDWPLERYSRYLAPVVEETLQAVVLAWFIRAHRVGFLVDTAILGFAVGTGFALIENAYYFRLYGDASVALWILRGFGTAIMHGGTIAVFGMISKTLIDRGNSPWLAFSSGLGLAIALHSAFNHFFLSPVISTLIVMLGLPLIVVVVFRRSETALRNWLGVGFDADAELLRSIKSGQFSGSNIGRYLQSLREGFSGEQLVDMMCYLRIHTELALRAKGELMMREMGFQTALEPATRAKFQELRYLEGSIGATGRLAMKPVLHVSGKQFWQLHMLEQKRDEAGPPAPMRHEMTRSFPRSNEALEDLFRFAEEFFERGRLEKRHRHDVCFALEEIFTNCVKYGGGTREIRVELLRERDRVIARLTDFDVEPWDVTRAPEPDRALPLEQRKPGGLGLFLTRTLVDGVDYAYRDRNSTITLTKRLGA